jgi:subtilase family serine protease
MPRSKLARRLPLVSIAACIAVVGALTAAAPSLAAQALAAKSSSAQARPVRLTASASPPAPAGAARLGQLASATRLNIEVTLNVPHQAALTAFLGGLTDPQSPDYQQFLRPGQFGPRFGPSLAQVAAVDRSLRTAGLSPGPVSANRLAIPVTGTAAAIQHAFGITLENYRLPGGRTAYASAGAPMFPAAVAPLVQGVLGLTDVYPEQSLSSRSPGTAPTPARISRAAGSSARTAAALSPSSSGPAPCSAAIASGGFAANTIASTYGMNLLYLVGDLGKGAKIGVAELEPNLRSDISAYERCYGIATKVSYVKVDGFAGTGAGSGEAALDIETIAGLVPKGSIDVYQAPNTGTGFYDIFKKFVTSDTDKVLSVSWGNCEAETALATAKAQETVFEQANAQGQVVFAAAGDEGSTGCYNPGSSTANDALSTVSPASEPYVLGVGGTSFADSKFADQVVWNDSGDLFGSGAGGGGVSTFWCMPGYQDQRKIPGVINGHSVRDTSASCKTKHRREVPDLSANADPNFGYAVYYDGSWVQLGIGGTSAATPVWASVASLVDVSPWCKAYGSKAPALPQNIYKSVAAYHSYVYGKTSQVVRDVTSGNNDYTPSGYTGGLYRATRGYDMASGLGTPMASGNSNHSWYVFLAGLTQVLCHETATRSTKVSITRLSRDSGPAGKKTKITVTGHGFLPIRYADQAWIISGSKVLAKVYTFCSTTKCTVTLPSESAKTVEIKIYASSLWSSRAVRYIYKR